MLRTASTPSSRSRRSAEAHILYAICRTEMSGRFFAVRVCAQAVHASAQSSIDNQLVKNLVEFRRRCGERKSNHFLRRHVRLRKYFSACKRARRPPKADGACAAAGRKPFRQKSTTFLTKKTPQAWPAGLPLYDAASAAVSISSLGRRRAAPSSDHSDSSAFFSADSFLIFGMPQMNAGSTTTISA